MYQISDYYISEVKTWEIWELEYTGRNNFAATALAGYF
jgi:hypothetical protein